MVFDGLMCLMCFPRPSQALDLNIIVPLLEVLMCRVRIEHPPPSLLKEQSKISLNEQFHHKPLRPYITTFQEGFQLFWRLINSLKHDIVISRRIPVFFFSQCFPPSFLITERSCVFISVCSLYQSHSCLSPLSPLQ